MNVSGKKLAKLLIGLSFMMCSASSVAVYTEPTRRIALNEILDLSTEPSTYPLYLRYGGRYYAELYLEDEHGQVDSSHETTKTFLVQIDIARKGRLLKSETKQVSFAPGEPHQTLFWARAPLDLPQRKNLDKTVKIVGLENEAMSDSQSLRLQVTRKFEFAPIFR